jgi:predicted amidophosphoribosyltransferase
LLVYEGAARELVARLKYRNARSSVAWLAGGMARLVDPAGIDVVTWAPTTVRRRRDRGFDQAEVLARGVARCLGRPARGWLRRVAGPAQTGRAVEERWHGPRFDPTGVAVAQAARVLVVDDVVTTGASLAGAGRALRSAGAAAVIGLAAAWTPPARRRATS